MTYTHASSIEITACIYEQRRELALALTAYFAKVFCLNPLLRRRSVVVSGWPADACASLYGGGWTLVRRVQAGNSWHPATDDLSGTAVYGSVGSSTGASTFSIGFAQDVLPGEAVVVSAPPGFDVAAPSECLSPERGSVHG